MEDQRLKDKKPAVELMEEKVKVDTVSEDLDSTHKTPRALIQDRDPRGVNKGLRVTLKDVIAEPPSVWCFDKVWLWSHAIFSSLMLAVPVSLVAGLLFAVVGCLHIWLIMPCVRLLLINICCVQNMWGSILNILISHFFTSIENCCGQIIMYVEKDKDKYLVRENAMVKD